MPRESTTIAEPKRLSIEEAAEEVGGLQDEIYQWIQNGEIELLNAASARDGQISEEDLRRIERHQVEIDIYRLFGNPEAFLDTPFERFDGKTPRQLLGTDDADFVRDIVWQVKSGAY